MKSAKDDPNNGAILMNEAIGMKDFFNHDKRITLLENAIISIDKRFDQVDNEFDKVERRFEKLENKMDSQFKWIIGCIGALSLTTISTLITVINIIGNHS